MTWRLGGVRVRVDYFGILIVTGMLLLDRSGCASAALAACCLHEGGHALAMTACKVALREVRLCPWGIRMERAAGERSRGIECLIAASGPAVNLLAALILWPASGRTAAVQAACGLFNLLPLEGMDGGDLLRLCVLSRLPDRRADAVHTAVTLSVGLAAAALGIAVLFRAKNPTLLLAALYLVFLLLWQKSRDK